MCSATFDDSGGGGFALDDTLGGDAVCAFGDALNRHGVIS